MERLPLDFVLKTERLLLRMPRTSDIPHVFEASRTPGFNDGMLWDPPANLEELEAPLARAIQGWRDVKSYQFTIEFEGGFAGRIALRPTDEPGVLDTGYWTHPRLQGRGIMTEALRAVVALAFERLEARAVVACFAVWNEASRRVMERVGFQIARVEPGGFVKGDRACDEAHARLERADWERITSIP